MKKRMHEDSRFPSYLSRFVPTKQWLICFQIHFLNLDSGVQDPIVLERCVRVSIFSTRNHSVAGYRLPLVILYFFVFRMPVLDRVS